MMKCKVVTFNKLDKTQIVASKCKWVFGQQVRKANCVLAAVLAG